MKFSNKYNFVLTKEKENLKEVELFDGLQPLTISEQVERFKRAGQVLEMTRRTELEGIRGYVDDPEDFEDLDPNSVNPSVIKSMLDKVNEFKTTAKQKKETVKEKVDEVKKEDKAEEEKKE